MKPKPDQDSLGKVIIKTKIQKSQNIHFMTKEYLFQGCKTGLTLENLHNLQNQQMKRENIFDLPGHCRSIW